MRIPRSLLCCGLVLVAGVVLTGCMAYLPGFSPPAAYPRIVPEKGEFTVINVTYTFPFRDGQVTITIPVDQSVYRGANKAVKTVTIYDEDIADAEWQAGLYRTMIDDPAQEPFYTALVSALRSLKKDQNLDSDLYLELIAVLVQSIPYDTVTANGPKYPIETFVDIKGDCDDKSMLLAGLLAREGYAVALLYFEPENHMAVGVVCPGYTYRDCGYAFVESTSVILVGVSDGLCDGGIILDSDPLVIPVGNGTLGYGSCGETHALWDEVKRIGEETDLLAAELNLMEGEIEQKRTELDEWGAIMEHLEATGQTREYNRLVSGYNEMVRSHNTLLAEYWSILDEYTMLVDRHTYIIGHQYDRQGTYRAIFGT